MIIDAKPLLSFARCAQLAPERTDVPQPPSDQRPWPGMAALAESHSEAEIRRRVGELMLDLLGAQYDASYVWDDSTQRFGNGVQINMDPAERAPPQRACAGVATGLVLTQFAFWQIATTDGPARSFSIQPRRGGSFGLIWLRMLGEICSVDAKDCSSPLGAVPAATPSRRDPEQRQ